jgi:hypothetical protein
LLVPWALQRPKALKTTVISITGLIEDTINNDALTVRLINFQGGA